MKTIKAFFELSAYESLPLMVILFIVSFLAITMALFIKPKPSEPMYYVPNKPELPSDRQIDKASYGFLIIAIAIIIYFFI